MHFDFKMQFQTFLGFLFHICSGWFWQMQFKYVYCQNDSIVSKTRLRRKYTYLSWWFCWKPLFYIWVFEAIQSLNEKYFTFWRIDGGPWPVEILFTLPIIVAQNSFDSKWGQGQYEAHPDQPWERFLLTHCSYEFAEAESCKQAVPHGWDVQDSLGHNKSNVEENVGCW